MPVTHCIPAGSPWNANQMGRPPVNTSTTIVQNPSGTPKGRLLYFPSTNGGASQINDNSPPADDVHTFTQTLLTDGWQVISINNPSVSVTPPIGGHVALDISTDSGFGSRFLQTNLHYWDHFNLWAQQTQGGPLSTVVAGFSWGAWIALQVALNRTSEIIGYIARSAPTQWSNTSSTASSIVFPQLAGVNTSGIDLQTMSEITVNSMSISGSGPYTVTLNCATSVAAISAGQWVVIDSIGAGGSNWETLNGSDGSANWGYHQVTTASGSTITLGGLTFAASVPSGAGGTALVRTNTSLNGLTIPGSLCYGGPNGFEDGAFVNPNDLGCMGENASSHVTIFPEASETHQWSTTDSTALSGWVISNFG